MNKQEYVENLRELAKEWAALNQKSESLVLDKIADELEQMDVAWVPREPTQEMIEAGAECHMLAPDIYRRMLNAAENTND